jgi:Family of unknown function (DUF5677)
MSANKLQNLAKLLDYGADCLKQSKVNVGKLRGAKKMLFPMMIASQSHTEAIFSLCRQNRTHICYGALRSLCDNLIKAKFLYCHPFKHSHVIFFEGLIEKEKQLVHAIDYLKNNSKYLDQVNFKLEDLNNALKKVRYLKKTTELKIKKHSGVLVLDTLGRAKFVDEHNKNKNKASNSLEWIYLLIFRQLSSATHLNYLDFKNYFKLEDGEVIVLLSGNPDDVNEILMLSEYLYKEMLNMFLRIFKNPHLKEFKKVYIKL